MKQKQLAMALSKLPKHPTQNAKLEQYVTDGDSAARWLMEINAENPFEDLDGGVTDLGAGNGILGIGALLLGAPRATFLEIDADACAALNAGLEEHFLVSRARVITDDIENTDPEDLAADVVIMNPPWGQQRRSADKPFLEAAAASAEQAIHVLHHSGAVHLEPWFADKGWTAERWMELELPLPRTYAHQKQRRSFTSAAMWCARRSIAT